MMMFVKIALISGFLFRIQCESGQGVEQDDQNDAELTFVHILFRHGDRNIEETYPNDPWQSEKFWPGGYGELTNLGKQQLFEVGEYLHQRYAKLLGDGSYSTNKVYIRSTDVDRVLMSAEACLAGLFPTYGNRKWNQNLNWQPIPVHSVPFEQEYVLDSGKQCDHYNAMQTPVSQQIYDNLTKKYDSLVNYLEENSGEKLTSLYDVQKLYDTLKIEESKNYSLPSWAENLIGPGSDLEFLALNRFPSYTVTTEMKKIRSGFLLKEILDRFTNKTHSMLSPNRSLWMYFAHETTIANMLNSLGVYKLHQPEYASCIFFELHQCAERAEDSYVQIFYKNSTGNEIDIPALDIPNCGSKCPLSRMYELYENILPEQNFDKECEEP